MQQLRDHALDTLEKLADGSIDTAQAGVTGKLCESVISTVKSQLEYSRMIGDAPNIPFMQTCHDNNGRLIEHIPAAKALKHEKH
jgi:hypothetical protein